MMIKASRTALLSAALFSAAFALPTFSAVDVAQAKTYIKHEHINRDKCYRVKKVPATVEYDTRGIKVRDSSRSWRGNFHKNGSVVRDKYSPEVFIQTRRVLEREHTTLVPVRCN